MAKLPEAHETIKDEPRKSLEQLALDQMVGLSLVQLGAVYRHNKGAHYTPTAVCYREHDMVLCVVYHPLSQRGVSFCRPLEEWKAKFKRIADPRA